MILTLLRPKSKNKAPFQGKTEMAVKVECGTCKHFVIASIPYDHCTKINVRDGWGIYTYMPTERWNVCPEWEEKTETKGTDDGYERFPNDRHPGDS